VYKNTRLQFEKVFCLPHKTTHHSPPKMQATFTKLGVYMEREEANVEVKGRGASYIVTNAMEKGAHIVMTEQVNTTMSGAMEDEPSMDEVDEVDDDGSLDI